MQKFTASIWSKLLVGVAAAIAWRWFSMGTLLGDVRAECYVAMIGLHGTLLGFSIAASTFVAGLLPHPALAHLKGGKTFDQLNPLFTQASALFLIGALVSFSALIGDRSGSERPMVGALAVGVLAACVACLAIMLVALHMLLQGVSQDAPGAGTK